MMEAHVIHPQGAHKSSIIWLHGLGADGFDFEPMIHMLKLSDAGVKFVLPHAPVRPITIHEGFPMPGWYDIITIDPENFIHDVEGIEASARYVQGLIDAEIAHGIAPQHIMLAGFSQGGAIALYAGLTTPTPIAGIIALSTYLPAPEVVEQKRSALRPPILLEHGTEDIVIRPKFAEQSHQKLVDMGYDVSFNLYPMAHSVCESERVNIRKFIQLNIQIMT